MLSTVSRLSFNRYSVAAAALALLGILLFIAYFRNSNAENPGRQPAATKSQEPRVRGETRPTTNPANADFSASGRALVLAPEVAALRHAWTTQSNQPAVVAKAVDTVTAKPLTRQGIEILSQIVSAGTPEVAGYALAALDVASDLERLQINAAALTNPDSAIREEARLTVADVTGENLPSKTDVDQYIQAHLPSLLEKARELEKLHGGE